MRSTYMLCITYRYEMHLQVDPNDFYALYVVTWYCMQMLLLLAVDAGTIDVFDGLFCNTYVRSNVISRAILWLTLPSITVPFTTRICFGNKARLKASVFLPLSLNRELWYVLVSRRVICTFGTRRSRTALML